MNLECVQSAAIPEYTSAAHIAIDCKPAVRIPPARSDYRPQDDVNLRLEGPNRAISKRLESGLCFRNSHQALFGMWPKNRLRGQVFFVN